MKNARSKTKAAIAEAPAEPTSPDVFDEAIATQQNPATPIVQELAEHTRLPDAAEREGAHENGHHSHAARHHQHREEGQSHGEAVGKKEYAKAPNPFGFESKQAGKNRVQLLKSETDEQRREGRGAWVIRFAHNPNLDPGPDGETYSKQNPHPVLKMLKAEGYRWDFDAADNKGGWGKPFTGDRYGQEHLEARKALQKAVEMIGGAKEQGIPL